MKGLLLTSLVASASAKLVTEVVEYTHNGDALQGHLAWDDTWTEQKPAVIVAADWDGMTAHEENWAERVVALGYVGFANGVYDVEETKSAVDFSARGALTRKYATDPALWRGRFQTAVELLQAHPAVDEDMIGAVGFCFGGGGVLELGRANLPGVKGVVSVHGNFGTQMPAEEGNFDARVLVLHGANDNNILNTVQRGDNSGALPTFELELDAAGVDWEVTKFAGVGHGFAEPSSQAYDVIAVERSWEHMTDFFRDVFDGPVSPMMKDGLVTEWVDYSDGDEALQGYLVYDPEHVAMGPLPAVLVMHDWDGITDKEMTVAKKFASLGYVAFASGVFTPDEDVAAEEDTFMTGFAARRQITGRYNNDNALHRSRAAAAVAVLFDHEAVDNSKIAAVGYCFGGGSALELARANIPGVVGVVSLHGSLSTMMPGEDLVARVLVLHGSQDNNILDETMWGGRVGVTQFIEDELTAADAEWELTKYSRTAHSFTDPAAGSDFTTGNAYSPIADQRSWASLTDFLAAVFGTPYEYPNPVAALPSDSSTDEPTDSPDSEDTPTDEPTDSPDSDDTPTDEPTDSPDSEDTSEDTPTDEPTDSPDSDDTPTDEPTDSPDSEDTSEDTPTDEPTDEPTDSPDSEDTSEDTPTDEPTDSPDSMDTPTEEPEDSEDEEHPLCAVLPGLVATSCPAKSEGLCGGSCAPAGPFFCGADCPTYKNNECYCDSTCHEYSDCCDDAPALGECDMAQTGGSQLDMLCALLSDLVESACPGAEDHTPALPAVAYCEGECKGGQFCGDDCPVPTIDTCFCDSECYDYGDCCADAPVLGYCD